jgi:hypothetical protein
MNKLRNFADRNPVRIAAWVSSTVALVVAFLVPDMPVEPAVAFVLSSLGLGEFAQKVENEKTLAALYTDPED